MISNAAGNSERQVNDTTNGGQFDVSIMPLQNGGWLAVRISVALAQDQTFDQRGAYPG